MPASQPPSPPTPPDTRTLPLHQEISRQAHALWEGYGRPDGRDVDIWREAEKQVLGTDPVARKQGNGTVQTAPLVGARPKGNRNTGTQGEPTGSLPSMRS